MKTQSPAPQTNFTLIADNGCIRFGRVVVFPTQPIKIDPVQLELELKMKGSEQQATNN